MSKTLSPDQRALLERCIRRYFDSEEVTYNTAQKVLTLARKMPVTPAFTQEMSRDLEAFTI